jgi:hypothetical protein
MELILAVQLSIKGTHPFTNFTPLFFNSLKLFWLSSVSIEQNLMPSLFRRKMISGKWFRYFPVFGRGENNCQPENDFRLTKNT